MLTKDAEAIALLNEIERERDGDIVHLHRVAIEALTNQETHEASEIATALVLKLGWTAPSPWIEIDATAAVSMLCRCLEFDLAYSSCRTMECAAAAACAGRFMDLVGHPARYFSNWKEVENGWSGTGTVLSGPTLEMGVVAVAAHYAGILWFEGED